MGMYGALDSIGLLELHPTLQALFASSSSSNYSFSTGKNIEEVEFDYASFGHGQLVGVGPRSSVWYLLKSDPTVVWYWGLEELGDLLSKPVPAGGIKVIDSKPSDGEEREGGKEKEKEKEEEVTGVDKEKKKKEVEDINEEKKWQQPLPNVTFLDAM